MKHPILLRILAPLFGAFFVICAMPVRAALSSPGSGDVAIYTQGATAGPAIVADGSVTTNVITHDFDNNDREDAGSFSRAGTDITLARAGYYLAIYNARFDRTDAADVNRSEIQSYLTLGGTELPIGWSQGYLRRQEGANSAVTAGVAVFSANAADVLNLRSFRTDNNPAGTAERAANGTALQLVKLDDENMSFAELSLAATAFGPNSTTYLTVPYDTETLGDGFVHGAPGELTLLDGGKYLVTANTYVNGAANRTTLTQRLTLDGMEVTGSKTVVYLRGASGNSCQDGAAAIGMIIDAAPGSVLSVQGAMGDGDEALIDFVGGRCALTVVKLPAGFGIVPDYIRLSKNADQDVNLPADQAITFTNQEETPAAAFTHVPGGSAVTVNTAGDYLFFGSVYDNDGQVTRAMYYQGWSINGGAREQIGETARYARDANDSTGIGLQFGNSSGLVADGLAAADTVEMVSRQLGKAGINNANRFAMQGVRLASLFVLEPFGVDTSVATLDVSEVTPTTSASYEIGLRSPTTGTVEVTVSADADTVVSLDDVTFGPSAVLTFNAAGGTTLQTVYVRAVDDSDVESVHTSVISSAVTSSDDANFPTTLAILDVTVNVTDNDVVPVTAVADASTSNAGEDTVATEAVLAPQANLLANDADGIGNFVSTFDAVSTLGATVNVAGDGTFTYNPGNSAAIQALAVGATAVDTFTYTVEDVEGNTSSATVSITVDGANDAPEAMHDILNDGPLEDATSWISGADLTGNDGIYRTVPLSFPAGSDLRLFPGKTVTQSPSTGAPPGGGVPENALDGNFGNFTHTDSSNDGVTTHSWQVDFGEEVSLESISLFNRTNCCGERMRDITVTVLDGAGDTVFTSDLLNPNNELNFTGTSGGQLDVDFGGPITGQTVVVSRSPMAVGSAALPADEATLSLGEVTIIGSSASAFKIDNLLLHYDAGQSANTGRWENLGSRAGASMDWLLTGVTLDPSPGSTRAQISAAYVWDDLADRARLNGASDSIHDLMPGVDTADATWEFWVKPDNTNSVMTLFETGGGTGFGVIINNGVLEAATELDGGSKNGSYVSYDLVTDPMGLVGNDPTTEFNQYAVAIDTGRGLSLYVNGVLVAQTTSGSGNDWDGGDGAGLGIFGEANHGGFINTAATASGGLYNAPFLGSMAAVRLYSGVLTAPRVLQNYLAVANGTDLDGDPIAAVGVIDATGALVPIGTPATLASGALVTMTDASGGFDYNPNGAFSLSPGVSATDTFTYQVSDGNGGTAEADVTVTITGSVLDAFDDTVAVLEDGIRTIFANQLVGNDESDLGAADAYVNLNPDSIAGTVWTDNGSSTRNTGTIDGTVPAAAIPSNFGALGTGVTSGTMEDLDPVSAADATIEIWFKPDPGQTGKSTIFETGGNGNGFSIVFDADTNEVIATVDGGDDLTQNIRATAAGVVTGEFNQLIVVYDKDGGAVVGDPLDGIVEDLLTLYLNNDPAAGFDATVDGTGINTSGIADDWCGTDNSGFNSVAGTSALDENFAGMSGAVAILRLYERILTPAEMEANFDAVVQPITAVTSPTTLEGKTVTLNADGSVTIDYTGVSLLTGEILPDAFTYSISDGAGGSTSATANVEVTGYSVLQDWRLDNGLAVDGSEDLTDNEGDGLVALLELGFGTDPMVPDHLPLLLDGTRNGTPVAVSAPGAGGLEFDAVFVRRKDYAEMGLTYTVQFSTNLVDFYDSTDMPTVVVDSADGIHEVVKVPYPFFTPDGKAQYFRVKVDLNP